MSTIYTTTEAVKDGYVVRPNPGTFLEEDGQSFVQFEYGTEVDGEFQPIGFCYEA